MPSKILDGIFLQLWLMVSFGLAIADNNNGGAIRAIL
jgi:hypothetical protein